MASTFQGNTITNIAKIGPTYNDLYRADRPSECISWRSFSAKITYNDSSGANGLAWYMVNLSSTVTLMIRRVGLGLSCVGWATPQLVDFALTIGRSYTATPTTTGTLITTTGNQGKHRTSFSPTGENTQILYSASGTGISVPTRTLDSAPIAVLALWSGFSTIGGPQQGGFISSMQDNLFKATDNSDYPIILAQNEGIEISNITAVPTGGTYPLVYATVEVGAFLTGWANP